MYHINATFDAFRNVMSNVNRWVEEISINVP